MSIDAHKHGLGAIPRKEIGGLRNTRYENRAKYSQG